MKTIGPIHALAAAFALAGATVAVSPAEAGGTVCDGSLFGVIQGNVVVPAGAGCTMSATVTGNVTVEEGAGLLSNFSTIEGNVVGKKAAQVNLEIDTVGGNVRITGDPFNTADSALTEIDVSTVAGSVDITGSADVVIEAIEPTLTTAIGKSLTIKDGGSFYVDSASVGGSVTVTDNVATPGFSNQISNNTISKNLSCSGNFPAPLVFGDTVGGTASGQCV
jgi:DUF4097 and DUF4098 domain-containing protein YvlB